MPTPVEAEPVPAGGGIWGEIHSLPDRRRCYRLVPTDELIAKQRVQLDRLRERARWPGVAPLLENEEGDVAEREGHFYDVIT